MTWWAWTLVWFLLVAGALVVFFLLVRSLWRKGMALASELGTAAERLSAVTEELGALTSAADPSADGEKLAIFADPLTLRQERYLARRRGARAGRGSPPRSPRRP